MKILYLWQQMERNYIILHRGIIDIFKSNGKYLDRAYLHSVLHCLFFICGQKEKRDDLLWNTACDIMTEYTIDMMDKPCTKRILGYIRTKHMII